MADSSEKDYVGVNKWLSHSWSIPTSPYALVEVCYYGGRKDKGIASTFDWAYRENDFIVNWRLSAQEQSLDDALGNQSIDEQYHTLQPVLEYPKTTYKPSSEAELKAAEAARISSLLSDKLSTISDIASKLTRKNFSVADIKLVKDLLESVEEYEESL